MQSFYAEQLAHVCNKTPELHVLGGVNWESQTLHGMSFDKLGKIDFRKQDARALKRKCVTTPASTAANKRAMVAIKRVSAVLTNYANAAILGNIVLRLWRKRSIRNKGVCYFDHALSANQEELITLEHISTIPGVFFISLYTNNSFYTFDIRIFNRISVKNNPYTGTPFEPVSREHISKRLAYLKQIGMLDHIGTHDDIVGDSAVALSLTDKIVELCTYCEDLDMIVNVDWLLEMDPATMRNMWLYVEDIINYRSELADDAKNAIIPSRAVFCSSQKHTVRTMQLEDIKEYVVHQLTCLVTEGLHRDNRKLGVLYFVTGLTMCCEPARNSYSWLFQSHL